MWVRDNVSAEDHVYVAFLQYTGAHNIGSWLQHAYTGGDVMHVQIAFFLDGRFITYSSDATVGRVHRVDDKEWSRRGWKFYAIPLERATRERMVQRAESLLGTPYDTYTVFDFFCLPMRPACHDRLSCVHFTMLVLAEAGYFHKLDPCLTTDSDLKTLLLGLPMVKHNAWIVNDRVASINDETFSRSMLRHPAMQFYVCQQHRNAHAEQDPDPEDDSLEMIVV